MMLLSVFFYPTILLILLLPTPSDEAYTSTTTKRLRGKILMMVMELIKDVKMKIKSIQHLRRMYYENIIFQVGEMVYDIRKKFKRMIFLFHLSETHNVTRKIVNVVECQQLNLDIDKLIHMIEEYEWKRKERSETHKRFQHILRTKEQNEQEVQKKRDTLRTQMEKIRSYEKEIIKRQKHLEDGFDTE